MKILTDSASRAAYSADASIFQAMPQEVVIPENKDDLHQLIKKKKPLIPRGGGTSTTGASLGDGVVVDLSVYFNKILHFDQINKTVTVEPGIVLEQLNLFLKPFELKFGPDTSTANRATIGGMIGNNAAGSSSLLYGTTQDALLGAQLLLSTGEEFSFQPGHPLTHKLLAFAEKNRQLIEKHFPKMPRRVSGYALDTLLTAPVKIVAGSEGTLGILTEVTLSLVPLPEEKPLHVYFFHELQQALLAVPLLLKASPTLLELMDRTTLLVEGDNLSLPPSKTVSGDEKRELLERRRSELERLFSRRSYEGPCGFLEDMALPPHLLAPFMEKFIPLLEKRFGETAVYGHAGAGCLHIRPFVDLREPGKLQLVLQTMKEATVLLKQLGGTLSGEHGDGWLRSWLNQDLYGKEVYHLFKELKALFDPFGLMNPGKIVSSSFPEEKLRKTLHLRQKEPNTFLNFKPEGGLTLAADLCNGNGLCRKKSGFMCPSFQVTGEEIDGPKGRAQAIRNCLHDGNLADPDLQGVLNRCLSCKGCQIECPSHVDIAKMKAEALYRHQKSYGTPLRSRFIARMPDLLPYIPAAIFNLKFGKTLLGFADRPFPKRVTVPFSQRKRERKKGRPLLLFVDTFTEWFEPEVGEATVRLLEHFGYDVELLAGHCCGRTAYSKGLLEQARNKLEKLKNAVMCRDIPVVAIEPTCQTMAHDEAKGLLETTFPLQSLEQFLHQLPWERKESGPILLHVHCHRKATGEAKTPLELLKRVVGDAVSEINSGCCGMAGSFGYEKEHEELSIAVANLVLVPTIEKHPDALIVATGFSCRSQLRELTGRTISALPTLLCEIYGLKFGGSHV